MIRDVLEHADLSIFTQLSLVIFALVFVAIALRVLLTPRAEINRRAAMALESDTTPSEARNHG